MASLSLDEETLPTVLSGWDIGPAALEGSWPLTLTPEDLVEAMLLKGFKFRYAGFSGAE